MSYGMISGSETTIHLCPKLPTTNCSSLVWTTSMVMKQSKSIKTPCGLYRGRTRAAINCACKVKQENLYELLGVSERDTPSEIKKAYKKLALKYHPDVSPPDLAAEYTGKFIRVQEAYETLSDPQTRAVYDRDLGTGFQLAYSKRRSHHDQRFEEWGDWRERWQSQLMELHRRSEIRHSTGGQVPWGAGIGSQRFSHAFHN